MVSSKFEGKSFQRVQTVKMILWRMVQYRKATIYIIITVLLFLLFIPFLGGKLNYLHAASIKSTVGNKLGLFPSPFHISTSSHLTLTGAFSGGYVAACSSAFRSTTEENDSGGYVDVPCPSKVKQSSSTADWLKF